MKAIITFLLLCTSTVILAQTGTIKGTVLDDQSRRPLMGATVELLNAQPAVGVITDENGEFTLSDVPTGRQALRISYLGYETQTLPSLEVLSGKQAMVSILLTESFYALDEIVLSQESVKDRAINDMAKVSARQFGMEEVTRFSGGRSDVGRLAANFAGVSAPDDSRNDIVVRGNSPTGMLWRLEGIPIPSPNHFATAGTTGGPVSALNPNLLKSSDFLTSAFPAEYGNALGGVFDLGFRKGNPDTYEYNLQVGVFTGLEAMAEGRLGKKGGSFLLAGRYSLIGLLGAGAGGTSAVPNYSDFSYNLDFGRTKLGRFSLFGILGNSDIDFLGDEIDETDLFAAEDEDSFATSKFGVMGVKHVIDIGERSYLKTIIGSSFSGNDFTVDRYIDKDTPQERIIRFTEAEDTERRMTFSTLFNSKISKRVNLRTGLLYERFNVESFLRDRQEQPDNDGDGDPDLFTFRDTDESISLWQPYVQAAFRLSPSLDLNTGLHLHYSSLNEQLVAEPRASLAYGLNERNKLSFGFGVHHQNVPLPTLFLNEEVNGELVQTNRDLDFVRSLHYVLGYDLLIGQDWRAKVEAYYQDINQAGVEAFPSSYSTLTEGADFGFDNDRGGLVSEGTGYNQGLELTVEKFFSRGFYGLLTTSVFESKYEGSDGVERNSPFNNGYVVNLLAGREFKLNPTGNTTYFVDTRLTTSGGRYFTPIDLEASRNAGFEVRQEDLAFSEQYDAYFRWDVKFGLKINSKSRKSSHQFFVDLQNVTNNENVFVRRYNRLTNNIDQVNQIGFFPDVGYRFQF